MRKSMLRFAFVVSALAIVVFSACKGGVKDADLEKRLTEKISAIASDVAGATAAVKDGVVTLSGEFKDEAIQTGF